MIVNIIRRNVTDLPTNYSLGYYWCSGFMISAMMIFQIISGVILSFLYVCDCLVSFRCVMDLSNDSLFTWIVRYWHIWGVTFLFILFFIHMGRALYYSSYTKTGVWNVGFILYLLTMAEAFLGYILPWHQMSYWAATVLTSIVSSIPFVGETLFSYIVGGFSVSGETLPRVYSLHVCLGFVILGLMIVHLMYLHSEGTNNGLFSSNSYSDVVYFHSYFSIKDGMVLLVVLLILNLVLLIIPEFVVDIEGYLEANPMSTPVSIKPEWYFLVFYAMLRCIESKIGGLALIGALLFFTWVPTYNNASCYFVSRQLVFWFIVSILFYLTYLGGCHPEYPYLIVCKLLSLSVVGLMFIFKLGWSSEYKILNVNNV